MIAFIKLLEKCTAEIRIVESTDHTKNIDDLNLLVKNLEVVESRF